jgi:hypothetical protein
MTNPAMNTITTNADFTHPTLPPFQSPTTDPSPLSIDNEEFVVLDDVSPASTAKNPCTPAVNASTPAAAGKDTEVSNILVFFNHALWMLQDHSKCIWRYDNSVQDLHLFWGKQLHFFYSESMFIISTLTLCHS